MDVVMEQWEECREGNKAVGMWLWSIEKGVEMGRRQWECGYGALGRGIEGHREEWMWLWSNERSAEKETRQWKCGYS